MWVWHVFGGNPYGVAIFEGSLVGLALKQNQERTRGSIWRVNPWWALYLQGMSTRALMQNYWFVSV